MPMSSNDTCVPLDLIDACDTDDEGLSHRRLPVGGAAVDVLAELLELTPLAVIVTDGRGTVIQANRRAWELARGCPTLLDARREAVSTGLDARARREQRSAGIGIASRTVAMLLRRDEGRPLLAVLRRVGRGGRRNAFLISDPAKRGVPSIHYLCRLLSLSIAEARVAQKLALGESVAAIARQLGVTANTVRFHLKQIYAKTQTTGQCDLVSLLLDSPLHLALDRSEIARAQRQG